MRLRNEVLFGYKRTKLEVHNAGRLATHLFHATGGTCQIFRFHFLFFFWGGGACCPEKTCNAAISFFNFKKYVIFVVVLEMDLFTTG